GLPQSSRAVRSWWCRGSRAAWTGPRTEARCRRAAPRFPALGAGPTASIPGGTTGRRARFVRDGALVSELGPGAPPLPEHFPLRNRLISGISLGVVVVEASEKSGSLITARCALDQGRDVMAVPGSVLGGRNRGSHALLKDGAK